MSITNTSSSKSYKPLTAGWFALSNQEWKSVHHFSPANPGHPEPRRCLNFLGILTKGCQDLGVPVRQRNIGDMSHSWRQSWILQNTGFVYPLPSWHRMEPFSAEKRRNFSTALQGGEDRRGQEGCETGPQTTRPLQVPWRRLGRRIPGWERDP